MVSGLHASRTGWPQTSLQKVAEPPATHGGSPARRAYAGSNLFPMCDSVKRENGLLIKEEDAAA
jgi:hypothetical protein